MIKFFLGFFLLMMVLSQTPSPPVWPEQFEQEFTEDFVYSFLKFRTSGKIFYDFPNRRYRIDRQNGLGDRYCGTVRKLQKTACSHIVVDGKRYLYYPEKNDCCFCCDAEHGCGVLKPDWAIDAQFEGIEQLPSGQSVEKWNKKGLQNNFIFQTVDTKIMIGIDQVPNDFQHYNPNSFHLGISDPSVFELPSMCNPKKTCSWLSVCTPLRKSEE